MDCKPFGEGVLLIPEVDAPASSDLSLVKGRDFGVEKDAFSMLLVVFGENSTSFDSNTIELLSISII